MNLSVFKALILLSRLSRVYQHIIGKSAHFRGRFFLQDIWVHKFGANIL
jgi:hypothetical protein